jgi:hypothetical protein
LGLLLLLLLLHLFLLRVMGLVLRGQLQLLLANALALPSLK